MLLIMMPSAKRMIARFTTLAAILSQLKDRWKKIVHPLLTSENKNIRCRTPFILLNILLLCMNFSIVLHLGSQSPCRYRYRNPLLRLNINTDILVLQISVKQIWGTPSTVCNMLYWSKWNLHKHTFFGSLNFSVEIGSR
jgi:hypothetical protein